MYAYYLLWFQLAWLLQPYLFTIAEYHTIPFCALFRLFYCWLWLGVFYGTEVFNYFTNKKIAKTSI